MNNSHSGSEFSQLGLADPILRALTKKGYTSPSPIQAQAIPPLLQGRDILGVAQTGTGKTASFALPILNHLFKKPVALKPRQARALILAPTRELALQIDDSFRAYGQQIQHRRAVILGGVAQNSQVRAMARGVDILIATPGRLLDLMNQRHVFLDQVEILTLDEADRMLDMGFVHDVMKIVAALPKQRQSLLFSATMPDSVRSLAGKILNNPVSVSVTPQVVTADKIDQHVYMVSAADKRALLIHLLNDGTLKRVIVFTRTKHGANRVAETLLKSGISSEAIHGNKSQGARQRALANFRDGRARVLVATDIAARGIDIDNISHVINFELPNVPESYVHRIGRTARAGAGGIALSLCDAAEHVFLRDIEKLTKRPLNLIKDHPYAANQPFDTVKPSGHKPRSSHAPQRRRFSKPKSRRVA